MNKVTYVDAIATSCPKCGGKHIKSISRITGYLSFDERFGEGKVCEKSLRVDHNNKHEKSYK